jgi:hypothetical protein
LEHGKKFYTLPGDNIVGKSQTSEEEMTSAEQEAIDIAFVRARTGMVHVSDPEALAAFTDGSGIFDVDPHCRKLDTFVAKHKLECRLDSEDLLPGLNSASESRPVYYGRAWWIKRSRPRRPTTAA